MVVFPFCISPKKPNIQKPTCIDTVLNYPSQATVKIFFADTAGTELPVDDWHFFGSKKVYGLCLNVKSNR